MWPLKSVLKLNEQESARNPNPVTEESSGKMIIFGAEKPIIDFAPALNPSVAPFLFPASGNRESSRTTHTDSVTKSNSSKATLTALIRRPSPTTLELVKEAETSLSAVISRILDQIHVRDVRMEEQAWFGLSLEPESHPGKVLDLVQSRPIFEYD
jgi:hypothetical protein